MLKQRGCVEIKSGVFGVFLSKWLWCVRNKEMLGIWSKQLAGHKEQYRCVLDNTLFVYKTS